LGRRSGFCPNIRIDTPIIPKFEIIYVIACVSSSVKQLKELIVDLKILNFTKNTQLPNYKLKLVERL